MKYEQKLSWILVGFATLLIVVQIASFLFMARVIEFHPVSLLGVLPFIGIIFWQFTKKFSSLKITSTSLQLLTLGRTSEIQFSDIRGYHTIHRTYRGNPINYLLMVSNSGESLKVRIHKYQGSESILEWIQTNFIDLDLQKADIEIKALHQKYSDVSSSTKSRASSWGFFVNMGGALSLFTYFFPIRFTFWFLLMVPIVGMLSIIYFKGLIVFRKSSLLNRTDKTRSRAAYSKFSTTLAELDKYPKDSPEYERIAQRLKDENASKGSLDPTSDVVWGISLPSILLAIRTFQEFNIYNISSSFWTLVGISLSVLFFLSLFAFFRSSQNQKIVNMLIISSVFFVYSFGGLLSLNCLLDDSKPKFFYPRVSQKNLTRLLQKGSSWIDIGQWGKIKGSRDFVSSIPVGDKVVVRLRKGFLGCSWFTVLKE